MSSKMKNPWDVVSLYEFQYFLCPSCSYKQHDSKFFFESKQEFVTHTFHTHPESVENFKKISDGSLNDVITPWELQEDKILSENGGDIAPTYGDLFFGLKEKRIYPRDANYADHIMNWIKTNVFQKTTLTMTETKCVENFSRSFKEHARVLWKSSKYKLDYGISDKIDQFLNNIIDVSVKSKIQEITNNIKEQNSNSEDVNKADFLELDEDCSNDTEYSVEKIIDKDCDLKGNVKYLIKWKGYEDSGNTWEPIGNLYCDDLIEEFEKTLGDETKNEFQELQPSLLEEENYQDSFQSELDMNDDIKADKEEVIQEITNDEKSIETSTINDHLDLPNPIFVKTELLPVEESNTSVAAKKWTLKRACETDEQRQLRLFKQSQRSRISRLHETESAKKERLEKDAKRMAMRRAAILATETEEERNIRLVKAAERRRIQYASLTEEQKLKRRLRDAETKRLKRENETEEEKMEKIKLRRIKDAERKRLKRAKEAAETDEEKKLRLEAKKLENNESIICDICGKSMRRFRMKKHKKLVHEKVKEHECTSCGKRFGEKSGLKSHIQMIHEDTKHACEQCGKLLSSKQAVIVHVQTFHEKKRDFPCDLCTYVSGTKQALQKHTQTQHLGIHEERKTVQCDRCPKVFLSYQGLDAHIQGFHEKLKPFKCEITSCEKSFSQLQSLQYHIRVVHENIKQFECNICKKPFGKKSNLTVHMKTAHEKIS